MACNTAWQRGGTDRNVDRQIHDIHVLPIVSTQKSRDGAGADGAARSVLEGLYGSEERVMHMAVIKEEYPAHQRCRMANGRGREYRDLIGAGLGLLSDRRETRN